MDVLVDKVHQRLASINKAIRRATGDFFKCDVYNITPRAFFKPFNSGGYSGGQTRESVCEV